jgi:hypothetical protein
MCFTVVQYITFIKLFQYNLYICIRTLSFQAAIPKAAHGRVGNPYFEQSYNNIVQCSIPAKIIVNFQFK